MLRLSLIVLLLISVVSFGQDWTPQSGVYYRMVFKNSEKAIRPVNASNDNVETEQWEIDAGDESQLWSFNHIDGNYYMAINKKSEKAYDIWDRDPNDVVGLWSPKSTDNENQQIKFQSAGGDYFYIYDRKYGNVADVYGNSTQNGAKIISYSNHYGDNQQVKFVASTQHQLRVQFKDEDGTSKTTMMRLEFKIINDGPTAYDLNNTTLTYYFSDPARNWTPVINSFLCNEMQMDNSAITPNVVAEPLLSNGWALTLKFSAGTINAKSYCWFKVGVNNEIWATDESNDYSYISGINFQDDDHIVLTQTDQQTLLWGAKPSSSVQNGHEFTVSSNPIISIDVNKHYSSDPVVAVINDALVLATSTDLYSAPYSCGPFGLGWCIDNDYPMDGIHLYTTYGENILSTRWWEHGTLKDGVVQPILSSQDFSSWADVGAQHMFAPDIQYVPDPEHPDQNKIFMYIPMPDKDGKWGIGVANTNANDPNVANFYDNFSARTDRFILDKGTTDDFSDISGPVDPGVFPEINSNGNLTRRYFMLYVSDASCKISLAILDKSMVKGTGLGHIKFAKPYDKYSVLYSDIEGPDVSVMHSQSGKSYYYMVFSVRDPTHSDVNRSLIGYAKARVDEFNDNQTGCWHFKGWIFQTFLPPSTDGLDWRNLAGNNHTDLVEFGGKHYIFYQQGKDIKGNHQRQVCCKELELIDDANNEDDGDIIGVTAPNPDLNYTEGFNSCNSIDGMTKFISRGFVNIKDDTRSNRDLSTVHLSSIKNVTEQDLYPFKLVYYFTIEPGANMTVEQNGDLPPNFRLEPIRHLGSKTWAAIIDYLGASDGSPFAKEATMNVDLSFKVHCVGTNGDNNYKFNDFSQPMGYYNTRSTRIGLFHYMSDPATDAPLCGEKPVIDQTSTKYFRNAMKFSGDADWSYLTLSLQDPTKDGIGIYNRFLNTGWTEQEWYIENVEGKQIGSMTAPPGAVRICNLKTSSGTKKYMTCTSSSPTSDADGANYWILNQTYNANSANQVWIKVPLPGYTNCFRLRSMWNNNDPNNPIYLTRYKAGNQSDTYGKKAVSTDSDRQLWFIE
jgi:hypothetical protein